ESNNPFGPLPGGYNYAQTLRGMQAMVAVLHNRLQNPAHFGAPGASTLSQLLVPSQFAGFSPRSGGGVTITASLHHLLDTIYHYANTTNANQPPFRQLIQGAVSVAGSPVQDPFAAQGGSYFWRTVGTSSPGGDAVLIGNGVLGGNQFFTEKKK